MVGDVCLKLLTAMYRRLARRLDGQHDLLAKPGQSILETEQRESIAVGVVLAAELAEEFVGKLQVVLGDPRIVMPIQIGDGIRRCSAQRPAHTF